MELAACIFLNYSFFTDTCSGVGFLDYMLLFILWRCLHKIVLDSFTVDAWGWYAGTAQGDGMGRGEGGGFRMGSMCISEILCIFNPLITFVSSRK